MFGPKRDEIVGSWRKLHTGEINNLYYFPNILRMNKSRKMRSAGNVARIGKRGMYI
jgi:hypothetical protein